MNGLDRRSVLRHAMGAAAVLGATAGLVALKAAGTGAPSGSEPTNTSDPVLNAVQERLAPTPATPATP